VARLIVNPQVLRCFLRWSLTEVPSLHRSYSASSVLRTSPPPQSAWPGSRELPVDPTAITPGASRVAPDPLGLHAVAHTPAGPRELRSLITLPSSSAFPRLWMGRLLHYQFRGLLSVHSRYNLQTRRVALCDPLHRRLRRLCCLRRRSDCYRVERSSSRAGLLLPAVDQCLFTAHHNRMVMRSR
jgi:hypothetical protein